MNQLDQSQFLRIFDADETYQRWQSYYRRQTVEWESEDWEWTPFTSGGITAGLSGDEGSVTITVPAIPRVINAFQAALNLGRLVELRTYQFDPLDGDQQPQTEQLMVSIFVGQVVGGGESLTELTFTLGSALTPIGAQIPPRTLTTRLIGKGCRL